MRRLITTSALIFAAAAAAPAVAGPQSYPAYGSGTGLIRCESNDGRVRECATGGGRVILERQQSRAACIEGRTWGYARNGIWVAEGCRGDFRIVGYDSGYGYGGNNAGKHAYGNGYGNSYGNTYGNTYGSGYAGQTIRCESNDGRMKHCAAGTGGRVQLLRQISRAACIEGRTWGSDYGGVWVSQGCRADFATTGQGNSYGYGNSYGNSYGGAYGGGRLFRCESNDGRTRECSANTRAGVQLVRQFSRAACIQGRTWGYGSNGIWVSQGCRAEFRSY